MFSCSVYVITVVSFTHLLSMFKVIFVL